MGTAAAQAAVGATVSAAAAVPAANDAAEHAALIAELDAAEDGDEAAPAPKPSGGKKGKEAVEETADESTDEGDDEVTEDDDDAETDEEEAGDVFESADELKGHLQKIAAAGDVRKLEKELGLEPGTLKVNGAKLRYVQTQVTKAQEAVQSANADKAAAENLTTAAKQFYGPYVQSKQQFQSGTPQGVLQAARAMEAHYGVPLTTFVEAVLKAGKGEGHAHQPNQSNAEVAELRHQVQTLLQQTQNQQTAAQVQAAQARHIETIGTRLKGTELAKLKDGAKLVYDRIIGSFDPALKGYKLKLPDAIKATLEDPATKWRLHELKNGKGGKTTGGKNGKVTPPVATPQRRRVAVVTKTQTPAEAEAAERAALIAELEAEERRAERLERRK